MANPVTRALGASWHVVQRSLSQMIFGSVSGTMSSWLMPRSVRNYQQAVGDGLSNSIVVAVVSWVARSFPEAILVVRECDEDGELQVVPGHPLVALVERPNPFYSGTLLWMATLSDWITQGNAYWVKVRATSGKVVQLWYVPASMIEPHPHETEFIDYYEYRPGARSAQPVQLEPKDVVHFRHGIDPRNVRKGVSPLRSLLREIFTDDEAANFSASILANLGVPGVIISPSPQTGFNSTGTQMEADADSIKQEFVARFGGDRRGEPLVMTAPTDVRVLSWSPASMDLRQLRRVPEERACAVLGLSAMVVGLGAGLDRSTFSNYGEARAAAWENNLIPTQRLLGEELGLQLLSDFEDDAEGMYVGWDNTEVRALAADMMELTNRARGMLAGGFATVAEARELVGMPTDDTHDVYLRPAGLLTVPRADGGKPVAAPSPLGGGGLGGGVGEMAPPMESVPGGTGATVPVPKYVAVDVATYAALAEVGTEVRTSALLLLGWDRTWRATEVQVLGAGGAALVAGTRLVAVGRDPVDDLVTVQVLPW